MEFDLNLALAASLSNTFLALKIFTGQKVMNISADNLQTSPMISPEHSGRRRPRLMIESSISDAFPFHQRPRIEED
jgi:hypothetical protein